MTERVGVRALQQHASETLRRASAGEVIEVTDRGRPIAKLVPIRGSGLAHLVDLGVARPARRPLASLPDPLPDENRPSLTALLAHQRESER